MADTQELYQALKEKVAKRDELMVKLDRSMEIQKVWPDAFAHGKCKCGLLGTPGRLRMRITRGDGSTEEFPTESFSDGFLEDHGKPGIAIVAKREKDRRYKANLERLREKNRRG